MVPTNNVLAPIFHFTSFADGRQQVVNVIADLEQASSRVLEMSFVTLTTQFRTAELFQRLLHRSHLLLTLRLTIANTNNRTYSNITPVNNHQPSGLTDCAKLAMINRDGVLEAMALHLRHLQEQFVMALTLEVLDPFSFFCLVFYVDWISITKLGRCGYANSRFV